MKMNKKNQMGRIALFAIALLLGLSGPVAAQQAEAILDKASQKYKESNGISAAFNLQIRSGANQKAEVIEGSIQMKGDKFTLKTPQSYTWYDGATQWVYMEQTEEVNVSKPEGDELQFTNPAVLLNTYKKDLRPNTKAKVPIKAVRRYLILRLFQRTEKAISVKSI